MTSILTTEEQKLLNRYNKKRQKHNKAQAEYRVRLKAKNPDYNVKYNAYMRDYNARRSKMIRNIRDKQMEQAVIPDAEVLLEMTKQPKTARGRRRKADMDIVPSYLLRQQNDKKLRSSSLNDYLGKANVIQKKFKNKSLSPQAMEEFFPSFFLAILP